MALAPPPPLRAQSRHELCLKYYQDMAESSVITSLFAQTTLGEYLKPKPLNFCDFFYLFFSVLSESLENKRNECVRQYVRADDGRDFGGSRRLL